MIKGVGFFCLGAQCKYRPLIRILEQAFQVNLVAATFRRLSCELGWKGASYGKGLDTCQYHVEVYLRYFIPCTRKSGTNMFAIT